MLQVFRSNNIEALVELLAREMDRAGTAPADPFVPLRVAVGSKGMERWLRHQLAMRLGARICANVRFPFPAQVLAEALATLEGGLAPGEVDDPAPDPWRPEVLVWAIMDILPRFLEEADDPVTAPLRNFLPRTPGAADGSEFGLAWQLANLFDRYVTFRPELALAWSRGGGTTDLPPALCWQPRLWAALGQHLGGFNHGALRWRNALSKRGPRGRLFDQPLRIFCISSLPPVFLERLGAISGHDSVDLFVLSPSPRYWAGLSGLGGSRANALRQLDRDQLFDQDDLGAGADGHPLLRSLGRVSRDLQLVLESLGDRYTDRKDCDVFVAREQARGEPDLQPASALHTLQADIRDLVDPASLGPEQLAARALGHEDGSIQFHSCYSPIRQVEALHEALLHLLERDPGLEPRDVLVMTPDIEAYAPLVGAIFEQGREVPLAAPASPEEEGAPWAAGADGPWGAAGAPRIPYQVAERSMRRTNPVAEVLLRTLELAAPGARFTASAFLELLAVEPFRLRFGVEAGEVETAREWIQHSGIRWAVDAHDRAAQGQPEVTQNTWRFGLERLALGVTMADDGGRLFDPRPGDEADPGLVPFDPLEGGRVLLLGKLMDAWSTLIEEVHQLRAPRPLGQWLLRLLGDPSASPASPAFAGTLGRLTQVSAASAWLEARVRTALVEMRQAGGEANTARKLEVGALAQALTGRFEVSSGATSVHTGAVTFAAMVHTSGVPYRVICLLGMDEGAFPQNPGKLHFDLTHRRPRVGDRDPRDEDRHLLLEAILAARDHLFIFWNGRDVRTNERRAPAVPVGELREVIDGSFPRRGERSASHGLTREHPLQPFSPACFKPGAPESYSRLLLRGARCTLLPHRAAPDFFGEEENEEAGPAHQTEPTHLAPSSKPVEEIDLDSLCRFFKDPPRYLLNKGLNLHLWDEAEVVEDREPVDPAQVNIRALTEHFMARRPGQRAGAGRQDQQDVLQRLRALGTLPLGAAGERSLMPPTALALELLTVAEPWIGTDTLPHLSDHALSVNLELELEDCLVRLGGLVGPLYGGDTLTMGVGSEGPWTVAGPWLQQVALAASHPGLDGAAVLLLAEWKSGRPSLRKLSYRFMEGEATAVRRAGARETLRWLVELYRQGQRARIPMLARTSWAFAWAVRNDPTNTRAGKALRLEEVEATILAGPPHDEQVLQRLELAAGSARGVWSPGGYGARGEANDVYNRLAFADAAPFLDAQGPAGLSLEFIRITLGFWESCLASRRTGPKPSTPPSAGEVSP